MAITSLVAEFVEPPTGCSSTRVVVFSAVVFTGIFGLNLWLVLAYHRESITTDEDQIVVAGVLRQRLVVLDEIRRADWVAAGQRPYRLVLWTPYGKVRISFANFETAESRHLIGWLRDRIDADVQENWRPAFDEYIGREYTRRDHEAAIASFHALRRRLLAWPPAMGLVAGLAAGAVLQVYAPEVSTWNAPPLIEWPAKGALGGIALAVVLGVIMWASEPESKNWHPGSDAGDSQEQGRRNRPRP